MNAANAAILRKNLRERMNWDGHVHCTMDDLGLIFADGVRFGQQHPNTDFGSNVEATQNHRNAFDDAVDALIVSTHVSMSS